MPSGEVDLERLGRARQRRPTSEADRDRRRTDRSISLMIEELDQLNRGLEKTRRGAHHGAAPARGGAARRRTCASMPPSTTCRRRLLMFDAQSRLLVICNQRYLDMYRPVAGGRSSPAARCASSCEHAPAVGNLLRRLRAIPDQQTLSAFGAGKIDEPLVELADGRTIAVLQSSDGATAAGSRPTRTSPSASAPRSRSPTWRATTR